MNSFIIYLLTILSSSITLTNFDSITVDNNTRVTSAIETNVVSYSIQKLDNESFNMMIVLHVSSEMKIDLYTETEYFENLLKISFKENHLIKMDKPIVEAFRGCKGADTTEIQPITTLRVNAILHLTEIAKAEKNFEINGNALCTMDEFCTADDSSFKLIYEKDEMTITAPYRTLIYSN
ncbi:hypothetical protein ULMA_16680 [Patiriisocius marinus]|uniref:Uncharacterized protein n=1 Tax=Patiriisocius marinus TaxID=1397112 RepID=A0A5J4J0J3_9FLAO|nr:hypothetical protein [Patiriisocius marinus]GER59560.1 hypothetical protein ULMA_16680 [Patiriisocius marinus]